MNILDYEQLQLNPTNEEDVLKIEGKKIYIWHTYFFLPGGQSFGCVCFDQRP
jgi:hypothetical protein